MLCDGRIEVRESASEVFSGLVHCGFFEVTPQFLVNFYFGTFYSFFQGNLESMASTTSNALQVRHAGVLGMAASKF